MNKILLFTLIFFGVNSLMSQQIYLETGKTISSFEYRNSNYETLDNLQSSNHTYVNIGYRRPFYYDKGVFININASYNGYGAIGSDRSFDNYFEWDLSYLGVNVLFDFELFTPGNFIFIAKAGASMEFLVQGSQTINNQVYNLSGEDDFDNPLYFLKGGLGIQYKVSETITVFNQYMYGYGGTFERIQGNLNIKTHNFGLGLLINISKNQLSGKGGVDNAQLEELKKEVEANSSKLKKLEESYKTIEQLKKENAEKDKQIALQDQELKSVKNAISEALSPYKGTDLNVEERQGKIYVALESDVIFDPGSFKVNKEGITALNEFGNVLANNPDLKIYIERHTDGTPYTNSDLGNRSLSLQRASSIIKILSTNKSINPKNIILSGRGEYDPEGDNLTKEGKTSNRRIEILIAPKLDKLSEIIKN